MNFTQILQDYFTGAGAILQFLRYFSVKQMQRM